MSSCCAQGYDSFPCESSIRLFTFTTCQTTCKQSWFTPLQLVKRASQQWRVAYFFLGISTANYHCIKLARDNSEYSISPTPQKHDRRATSTALHDPSSAHANRKFQNYFHKPRPNIKIDKKPPHWLPKKREIRYRNSTKDFRLLTIAHRINIQSIRRRN